MEDLIYSTDKELHELAVAHKEKGGRRHSESEIRLIVASHLVNHESISSLSEKYSVNKATIWRWICKFAERNGGSSSESVKNELKSTPMPRKKQNQTESPEEELIRLREENKRLQEALKMAEWRNHAKDMMIDIAEKTFNIPIRKKSGAKQ